MILNKPILNLIQPTKAKYHYFSYGGK